MSGHHLVQFHKYVNDVGQPHNLNLLLFFAEMDSLFIYIYFAHILFLGFGMQIENFIDKFIIKDIAQKVL